MLKSCVWVGALAFALTIQAGNAGAQDLSTPATPSPEWSATVRTFVDQDPALRALAPDDIADYCPRYASLDEDGRNAFWTNLLVQVAEAESGGDVMRTRWLVLDPAIHRPAFRRGLFQISIEAAHSTRYNCAVGDGAELTRADVNAACAVRILENTIGARNEIAAGGRYWPSLSRAAPRAHIAAATAVQAPCAEAEVKP